MNSNLSVASSACHSVLYDPTFLGVADYLDDASLTKLACTCKNLFQALLSDPFWKGRLIRTEVPELVQLAKGSPLCNRIALSFILPFLDDKTLVKGVCSSPALGSLLWKIDSSKNRLLPFAKEPTFQRRGELAQAYAHYYHPTTQDRCSYQASADWVSRRIDFIQAQGLFNLRDRPRIALPLYCAISSLAAFVLLMPTDLAIRVGMFPLFPQCPEGGIDRNLTFHQGGTEFLCADPASLVARTDCQPVHPVCRLMAMAVPPGGEVVQYWAIFVTTLWPTGTKVFITFVLFDALSWITRLTGIERPLAGAVGVAARRGRVLLRKCTSPCERALQPVARRIAPCWQRAQGHLSACWNWLRRWF